MIAVHVEFADSVVHCTDYQTVCCAHTHSKSEATQLLIVVLAPTPSSEIYRLYTS